MALLYLIISLLAISGVFSPWGILRRSGLRLLCTAGAIMVLFVFGVMMLNLAERR